MKFWTAASLDPSELAVVCNCGSGLVTVTADQHITADGEVVVPPRIASWLESKAGVTAEWRDRLRDADREAHEVMVALHWAALRHRADCGTNHAGGQRRKPSLKTWLSTSEAAREMNVTDRCVRKWIDAGRLPATMFGCRWLINRNDLNT